MTWRDRQMHAYPPDTPGLRYRVLDLPIESPQRAPRAARRVARHSPLPGCAACSETEPCSRHASFDLLASLGAVRDWETV